MSVTGEIYIITNTTNNMKYVGQTVSHRLNRGVYKPFGSLGRFKDHISEAICNTKKKQCRYLNNAIRKEGKDAFNFEVLHSCSLGELDSMEQMFIEVHKTLYPGGYNLTKGGKVWGHEDTAGVATLTTNAPKKRGGCEFRSEETRKLISERLKASETNRGEGRMKQTQSQHMKTKLEKFKDVVIHPDKIDTYIHERKDGVVIRVDGKRITSFVGKYENRSELKERAVEFLKQIISAMPSNCSGTP